jgi:hydroxypyruvate reductase
MTSTPDLYLTDPQAFLLDLYRAAVQDAQPLYSMARCLPKPPKGRTVVLGAGKAGGSMAQALEALWPADAPLSGLVVTRYHHIPPRPEGLAQRIEVSRPPTPCPMAQAWPLPSASWR